MKFRLSMIASAILMSQTALAQDTEEVERIEVKGKYLSVSESNSIKTPTPIIDVPQSLTIMTAEEISERGIRSVGEIINYTPGVNTSQGEGHRDSIVFRGIRSTADFYLDGNRDDVQYYRPLYNVEQVEILRGPNALLFGRGGTGGILNRVSKKADIGGEFTDYTVSFNSFGGLYTAIDTNVTTDYDSAVRINLMYESLDNHRDFFDGERYGFNPTARFELSDNTTLDLSYEYVNHHRFIDRGIPTGADGRPVEAFKDIVFADPQDNYSDLEAHLFRAAATHQFSDNVKGNFSVFYGDYDKVYANLYASGYDPETQIVELDGYIDYTVRDNLILSGNLVGQFETGSIGHTLIIGTEFISTDSDQSRFNPVFSTNGSDRETFTVQRPISVNGYAGVNANGQNFTYSYSDFNDDTRVNLEVFSLYVQDEIALSEHLDLVLGARFDQFDIEVFNADPAVLETRSRTDNEVSPRAGIIYKPMENISLYASYSRSFLPRSGEQYADINGNNDQLDPDTYSNREIGIKWDFAPRVSFTAAIFENEQSSPQVADNDPATLDVIDSDISGFELQFKGEVTRDWHLTVNYSNLDGEIMSRTGPTGRVPREVPEQTFSIWNTYQFSHDFGVALGATYQDESFIDNGNTAVLPSYTRIDASAFYQISDTLRLQLNIENLTDELYFPNAHATHQATVGAPLNATVSLVGTF